MSVEQKGGTRMKSLGSFLAIIGALVLQTFSSNASTAVSLRDVIQTPQRFHGKVIRVRGFLVIESQPRHQEVAIFYLGREDAKNHVTKNGVLVIPSQQMIRSGKQLDQCYVRMVGTPIVAPGPNGSYSVVMKDISDVRPTSAVGGDDERD
jgi:hypothetical protein